MNDRTKHHIYLGSQRLGYLQDTALTYFVLGDHLGSNAIVTDGAGAITQLTDYAPYGNTVFENTATNESVPESARHRSD